MHVIEELEARGLVQDHTEREQLKALLSGERVTVYAGFDPTAHSLHIGSLVPTIILARLQRAGHRPIALVGRATGMIGDPSGKSDERKFLDEETLQRNADVLGGQLSKFLDFSDSPTGALLVDNRQWFEGIRYIEFLRDVGKLITVNYMMGKDSVRSRLENRDQGISYTEFSYMLMQAYDFVHLAKEYGCAVQSGGSDQWGNITAGIELQRKLGRPALHGFTGPLLLDSKGQKMGKTSTGDVVWLDPNKSSPYAMYQYWLNTSDADVERFLKIYSWKSLDEIAQLVAAHNEQPNTALGQRALADEFTAWVHGGEAARRAAVASRVMFGSAVEQLSDADLAPLLSDVPATRLPRASLRTGIGLQELLAQTQLASSKGAARRLIEGGGIYVNNVRVAEAGRTLTIDDLATESMMILRAGKKKYHLVLFQE